MNSAGVFYMFLFINLFLTIVLYTVFTVIMKDILPLVHTLCCDETQTVLTRCAVDLLCLLPMFLSVSYWVWSDAPITEVPVVTSCIPPHWPLTPIPLKPDSKARAGLPRNHPQHFKKWILHRSEEQNEKKPSPKFNNKSVSIHICHIFN